MDNLKLNILTSCSNKSYSDLKKTYGSIIDIMVSEGLLAINNGMILRTELGLNLSKPMNNIANEKLGSDDYQLLLDSEHNKGDSLLLS